MRSGKGGGSGVCFLLPTFFHKQRKVGRPRRGSRIKAFQGVAAGDSIYDPGFQLSLE
jgi:hypothetical protein